MPSLRLFVGHDRREAAGLRAFIESLLSHASRPVEITIITERVAASLGVGTDGTNAFTKSRFLVPAMCGFRGRALWLDGADMLVRADIHGIESLYDWRSAVQVVKHDYQPKAERKYIGTPMEAPNVSYPRKNWSSAMAFWCEHSSCRKLTAEYVAAASGRELHQFGWVRKDNEIGDLSAEWNWLDEYGENPQAKIVHYTNGIPAFPRYRDAPHADEWREVLERTA